MSAAERGIGVLNAAPYGGGMLSKGPERAAELRLRVPRRPRSDWPPSAMEAACQRYNVPLAAAALQFSMRSEVITSTVVGVSSPERIAQTLELAAVTIPERALARARAGRSPP